MSPAESFLPIVGTLPKALILGSLPGQKSLADNRYYAHPRNAFWPIASHILQFSLTPDYAINCRALSAAGVALWDVVASARRTGSLDSNIERDSVRYNDIAGLLKRQPSIGTVLFNGRAAEQHFGRYLKLPTANALLALPSVLLPSTSPAYAAMSLTDKRKRWREGFRTARLID